MCYSLTILWRSLIYGTACIALAGCAGLPWLQQSPAVDPAPDLEQQQQQAQQREREQRTKKRQARIDALLSAADAAYADNRLTLPVHDNAYDRYAAVLLLDPGNRSAEVGLQSILLSYGDLIRGALRESRVDTARQLLEQAHEYYPDNPLLKDLQQEIDMAEEQARLQLMRINEQDLQGKTFVLPAAELSRKSTEIRNFLGKVARRLKDTDESVLIVARSDAEGRWIYQQMKEAVPDYRIRGDIRLASPPELRLLPPL